jgi:hypothetical protein
VLSVSNDFSFHQDETGGWQLKADRDPSSEGQLGADEEHPSEGQVAAKPEVTFALRSNSGHRTAGSASRPANLPRPACSLWLVHREDLKAH